MKTFKFAIALAGLLIAPLTSQADTPRALLGKWELTGMSLAGQQIQCPGELTLPPGVPDSVKQYAKCNAGEYIVLDPRGVYYVNITNIPTTSPIGTWSAVKEEAVAATRALPARPAANYLIVDDADETDDPQVYLYNLSMDRQTLTIDKSVGLPDMKFPKYLVEMFFTQGTAIDSIRATGTLDAAFMRKLRGYRP